MLRRPRMAFLVVSFFFAALPPQRLLNPQPDIFAQVVVVRAKRATRFVGFGVGGRRGLRAATGRVGSLCEVAGV